MESLLKERRDGRRDEARLDVSLVARLLRLLVTDQTWFDQVPFIFDFAPSVPDMSL